MNRLLIASATVALLLSACAADTSEPANGASTPPLRPTIDIGSLPTVPSPSGEPVTGEVPSEVLDAILADAVEETGVAEDEIEVVRAESVTWNDGSLGCPEPGQVYTQALVEGYHVVLDAAGGTLDYRVDSAGGFRICEGPSRPGG